MKTGANFFKAMYEIGQKVVCVKTHPKGVVKEGETYKIESINFFQCCKALVVAVGIKQKPEYWSKNRVPKIGDYVNCMCCISFQYDGHVWLAASRFRPLDDMYNEEIEELTEVLSEPVTF